MTQNNPANLKVKAGDPLSAKLWNRTIDRIAAGRNGYGGAIDLYGQTLIPYVVTQDEVDMGNLVSIKGFDGKADNDNPHDLAAQLLFSGEKPDWYSKISRVCVAAEPAKKDEQVFGCISGLALVKVSQQSASKRFVQVDPTDPTVAKQATGGFAKVIFEYGNDYCLVDMGERQNVWQYETTGSVSSGATSTTIKLKELDGTEYADNVTMKFQPAVDCKLDAGDTGLVIQCGNEWYALTSCSSFLGCPTPKDLMIYETGASPQWQTCDLTGKWQRLNVFECESASPTQWTIDSPIDEIQVGTALSCQVKECGQCQWQYFDTPVPSYTKISSCSFGCNCDEPVVSNPVSGSYYYTNCNGASGETGYLCFTLLTEAASVWACNSANTGTDECCVPIFPPDDCPDPCTV